MLLSFSYLWSIRSGMPDYYCPCGHELARANRFVFTYSCSSEHLVQSHLNRECVNHAAAMITREARKITLRCAAVCRRPLRPVSSFLKRLISCHIVLQSNYWSTNTTTVFTIDFRFRWIHRKLPADPATRSNLFHTLTKPRTRSANHFCL